MPNRVNTAAVHKIENLVIDVNKGFSKGGLNGGAYVISYELFKITPHGLVYDINQATYRDAIDTIEGGQGVGKSIVISTVKNSPANPFFRITQGALGKQLSGKDYGRLLTPDEYRKDISEGCVDSLLLMLSLVPTARSGGPVAGGGADLNRALQNMTPEEARRIQNAANRIGEPISVVGSRSGGPKLPRADSDWDYVIEANNATRSNAARSLPGAKSVREGTDWNQDVFKGPLDRNRPYITFYPE